MTCNTINNDKTIAEVAGSLLANRYRVVRQLGQGGMGNVWLVEDTQLDNRPFAVKMLPSIFFSNKRAYRQLKGEALVAMKLTHPNIVTLRAFEENNGNPFLVMDYIDGQTLEDYLAERSDETRGIPEVDVIRILRPIAAALDYAHGKGVVHRDVKPGNVMIAKDGTPYILDFGIAREIRETLTHVTGKLSSGTLLYMSPEQLNGKAPKPPQDVYSFAAMAYECLKGEPPFPRGQVEYQIVNEPPPPLAGGDDSVAPPSIAPYVMAGLAKKPQDRPPSCMAVLSGNFDHAEHVDSAETAGTNHHGRLRGGTWKLLLVVAVLGLGTASAWWIVGGKKGEASVMRPDEKTSEPPVQNTPSVQDMQEYVRLKAELNLVVSEAREKVSRASRFEQEPEGFESRLKSIGEQWRRLSAIGAPAVREEAEAALALAMAAGGRIDRDLAWLEANEEKRDALKAFDVRLAGFIAGDVARVDAEKYAPQICSEGCQFYAESQGAFRDGDFAEAERLQKLAWERFVKAVTKASVEGSLETARTFKASAQWDKCRSAVKGVLAMDPDNAAARSLKQELDSLQPFRTEIKRQVDSVRAVKPRVGAFHADPVGFQAHLKVVDELMGKIEAIQEPVNVEEAKRLAADASKMAGEIAREVDWLESNLAARDATRVKRKKFKEQFRDDLGMFEASMYATELYDDCMRILDEGDEQFRKGAFTNADRLFEEADQKFTETVRLAKNRYVAAKLAAARACMAGNRLHDCIDVLDEILARDASNVDARRLRAEARERLVPLLRVQTVVDGKKVTGAKINDGVRDYLLPAELRLAVGKRYGPYGFHYESGGKRYCGTIDAILVNWYGPRSVTVELREYVEKTIVLPGGAPLTLIYCAPGDYAGGRNAPSKVEHGFWLGKHEVTQRQWKSVMGWNPSRGKNDDSPVESFSWDECQLFIRKVNESLRCGARLPTSQEWEHACRAGTSTKYSWGDMLNGDRANCDGTHPEGTAVQGAYMRRTTPVGSYAANPWGFHDMHGNVWEWCSDETGDRDKSHVLRGGSWFSEARQCSSSSSRWSPSRSHNSYDGFRLCCSAGQLK